MAARENHGDSDVTNKRPHAQLRGLLGIATALLLTPSLCAAQAWLDVAIPASVVPQPYALAPAEPDSDGFYTIDLLILYTPAANAGLGGEGQVSAAADRLVTAANQYFTNSQMPVRYRRVGLALSGATSEAVDYRTNQADIAANSDVRAWRDASRADLVILMRTNEPEQFCGLGGLFNGGQQSDPPQNIDPERDAFAVFGAAPQPGGAACADLEHLFAHELGHNLGGGHQFLPTSVKVENSRPVGAYWKPYAHAFYCGLGTRNNTIMMGGMMVNGIFIQGGDMRSDYFSNPSISVGGLPCGLFAAGLTEGEADNARSISEAAAYVANYRQAIDARAAGPGQASTVAGGAFFAWWLALIAMTRQLRAGPRKIKEAFDHEPR